MVSEEGLTHFLELPVTVLLGDQDNDPADDSLRRTNEAMEQGQHRLARGIYNFASAQDAAASRELPLPWRLARVPGVDHQNVRMAPSAIQFLLQD